MEFIVEGLLRGRFKERFEGYRIAREIGIMNADDIAEIENMNPLPDKMGEKYFVPANWIDLKNAGTIESFVKQNPKKPEDDK